MNNYHRPSTVKAMTDSEIMLLWEYTQEHAGDFKILRGWLLDEMAARDPEGGETA